MSSVSDHTPVLALIGFLGASFLMNNAYAVDPSKLKVSASFKQAGKVVPTLQYARKPYQAVVARKPSSRSQRRGYRQPVRVSGARAHQLARRAHNEAKQRRAVEARRQHARQREVVQRRRVAQRRAAAAISASQASERVIGNARRYLGTRYRWGGESPRTGFDCSGLVQYTFKTGAGISLPRTAAQQYKASVKVPIMQATRGDLVFFRTRGRRVSHVGIYLGKNRFIHAPRTGKRIRYDEIRGYWRSRLVGFGRIPGACKLPAAYS